VKCLPLVALALLLTANANAQQKDLSYQTTDTTRFVAAHGRRAWIGGYPSGGLEVWSGPVQIANSIQVAFRHDGEVTDIPGASILRKLTYTPGGARLTYVGPDFTVEQTAVAAPDQPAVRMSFVVNSPRKLNITVRLKPTLDLMWPAAAGGQDFRWDAALSGYVLAEPLHRFGGAILAPHAIAHDDVQNSAFPLPTNLEFAITLDSASPTILFAGTSDPAQLRSLSIEAPKWEQQNVQQEHEALARQVEIETPDPQLNQALKWSEIALDQAWQCDDQLGCGYTAGYGPSRRNRRPQYAWFFAGDGMIDVGGAMAAGDYARAKQELAFIAKYQDAQSGMIWHELTLSAPYINWRDAYPYMFVHADLTFPYISTVDEYIRVTSDREFFKQIWPSVEKAYSYCKALVHTDDGLPYIPAGRSGINEQDQLTDELSMSASWVRAAEAYAHLADLAGSSTSAAEAKSLAERARQSIAKRYWSTEHNYWIQGYWIQGYRRNGSPLEDRSSGAVDAITEHLFHDADSDHLLDELASWRFQSDWGTRSIALGESGFDPSSYGKGSVWGLGTSAVAEAFWSAHRPLDAWQIWRTLIPWSSLDSMGHMHEVLAGDSYHPQLESVPEQTWTSGVFLSTFTQGLLGITINADRNQLSFASHLPADWTGVKIQRIKTPSSTVDLQLTQDLNSIRLHAVNHGAPLHFVFDPQLPLGARVVSATQNKKKVTVQTEPHSQDQHARVELELSTGDTNLELTLRDGVAIVLDAPSATFGDTSTAMKPISARLIGHTLTFDTDLVPARSNHLRIITTRKLISTDGATLQSVQPNEYELRVPQREGATSYERHKISVRLSR
jgi:glycogen debranching enzyme